MGVIIRNIGYKHWLQYQCLLIFFFFMFLIILDQIYRLLISLVYYDARFKKKVASIVKYLSLSHSHLLYGL